MKILKCSKTGFRFYYPIEVEGDNEFYKNLYSNHTSNLYKTEKWEFLEVAKMISANSTVLDIGCGGGEFFKFLDGKNCECFGLDKSDFAAELLLSKGIKFSKESIEDFSEKNKEKFDYITGFQILEHVKNPGTFLTCLCKMLKKGGTLFIAVPNNEPYFLKYDKYHTLNLPPHHMGLWNEESLTKMAPYFGLTCKTIKFEGFDYALDFFSRKTGINNTVIRGLLKSLLSLFFTNTLGKRTVLAIYTKN
ncbi:MAG: class I SAM-dependent methyltransferase [Bacteroidetes bacterium]|nr:class I SAM-dependent methyltransferase [Bacteroidota bacterium]